MNSRRGSTSSPIRMVKIWSASTASSTVHLQQRALRRVHRRLPELLRVHFAEALVALDREALAGASRDPLRARSSTELGTSPASSSSSRWPAQRRSPSETAAARGAASKLLVRRQARAPSSTSRRRPSRFDGDARRVCRSPSLSSSGWRRRQPRGSRARGSLDGVELAPRCPERGRGRRSALASSASTMSRGHRRWSSCARCSSLRVAALRDRSLELLALQMRSLPSTVSSDVVEAGRGEAATARALVLEVALLLLCA